MPVAGSGREIRHQAVAAAKARRSPKQPTPPKRRQRPPSVAAVMQPFRGAVATQVTRERHEQRQATERREEAALRAGRRRRGTYETPTGIGRTAMHGAVERAIHDWVRQNMRTLRNEYTQADLVAMHAQEARDWARE